MHNAKRLLLKALDALVVAVQVVVTAIAIGVAGGATLFILGWVVLG